MDIDFEWWFKDLCQEAIAIGAEWLINYEDPESYRDYYKDDYSPEEALHEIATYAAGDAY